MQKTSSRTDRWIASGGEYEYRVLTLPAGSSKTHSRKMIADQAEYGRWEMARSAVYWGGKKKIWLRRKILRVESTI